MSVKEIKVRQHNVVTINNKVVIVALGVDGNIYRKDATGPWVMVESIMVDTAKKEVVNGQK